MEENSEKRFPISGRNRPTSETHLYRHFTRLAGSLSWSYSLPAFGLGPPSGRQQNGIWMAFRRWADGGPMVTRFFYTYSVFFWSYPANIHCRATIGPQRHAVFMTFCWRADGCPPFVWLLGLISGLATHLPHNVGPPTTHQRYAISMAYCCWAVGSPTLCASWVLTSLLDNIFTVTSSPLEDTISALAKPSCSSGTQHAFLPSNAWVCSFISFLRSTARYWKSGSWDQSVAILELYQFTSKRRDNSRNWLRDVI